jgi:hypothetical protein
MARENLSALRQFVFDSAGWACQWPGCTLELSPTNPLQLAHLHHRGMGGSKTANTPDNSRALCRIHHDCLDGRTGLGTLRFELNELLKAVT